MLRVLFGTRGQCDKLAALLDWLGTGVRGVRWASSDAGAQGRLDAGASVWSLLSEGAPIRLVFDHAGGTLELDELSAGTRRLLTLHVAVLGTFGGTPMIDEFNQSFHTALTRQLLELAIHERSAFGQLIFTTHDTNLLDAGLLGADGIWFVEKDADGASHLVSLAEFDPDELAALTGHLEEGYLQGRFGGVPFFGDPARLGWEPSP